MQQNATKKLTEQQQQAIALLIAGRNVSEVAEEIGVNRTTIYRWQNDNPQFIAELNRLRTSIWEASQERIIQARITALDTIVEMLESDSDTIRMKAAEMLLRMKVEKPNGPTTESAAQQKIDWREISNKNGKDFIEVFRR